jgi:hypothetical protein
MLYRRLWLCAGLLLCDIPGSAQTVWTARDSKTSQTLWSLVWDHGELIAGSSHGIVLASPNGIEWEVRHSGTTTPSPIEIASFIFSATWAGTQWVVGGGNGSILTSPDAVSWTTQRSGTGEGFKALIWTGTRLVGATSQGDILTSEDGVTWTFRRTTPSGPKIEPINCLTRMNDTLIAAGNVENLHGVLISTDGLTWTYQPTDLQKVIACMIWTGSQLVAIAGDKGIYTSKDAKTWTLRHLEPDTSSNLNSVTWTGRQLVAVGSLGKVLTSPDGVTWTSRGTGGKQYLERVAWTGDLLVAVGLGGLVLTSPEDAVLALTPRSPSRGANHAQSSLSPTFKGRTLIGRTMRRRVISGS